MLYFNATIAGTETLAPRLNTPPLKDFSVATASAVGQARWLGGHCDMSHLWKLCLMILLSAGYAKSQYTNVTAIVRDGSGNLYANASYNVSFIIPSSATQQPVFSGTTQVIAPTVYSGQVTDSFGVLNITLPDNNKITPTGTQWNFSICAKAGTPCFTTALTITGASQDITSNLQSAAAPLGPNSFIPYLPTNRGGLTLGIGPGNAYCGDPPAIQSYAGGTLTLSNGATNYVYLDPASACAPTLNTSGFSFGQVPIATVTTAAGLITLITDNRQALQANPVATDLTGHAVTKYLNNILFVNQFPGADIGAKFNNACAALPPTGGTLYIEAGSYTATTQLFCSKDSVTVLGSSYGSGTSITSGLTGSPASSLLLIQNSAWHVGFIKFIGTSSSGHLISVIGPGAGPIAHISFDHVAANGTTGTGKDLNGASISAAGLYVANANDLVFENGSTFSNANDMVFDNAGASQDNAMQIRTSQIESATGDCILWKGSAVATDFNMINDDVEQCVGKGLNVTGGAAFSGLDFEAVHWEQNNNNVASPSIELSNVQGGVIHGGTVQCRLSVTVCLSAALLFTGDISGVGFYANTGTVNQLLSMKFLDATVQGNYFTTQAGATVTDQVKILTGSSGTRVGPNQYTNAGTTTDALNDAVAGVTYAVGSTALDGLYLSNKPLMMSSGGSYIQQALSNTQLDIGANGTGPVNLNVFSGSGTGGVQVGDGAGNINTLIQGNGRLDLRNDLLIEQVGTIGSPTDSFNITGTPTANRIQTLQDASDTFVYRGTTDTLSNKLLTTIGTASNCAVNSVSPAACGSAASGAFVVPTTTTVYTVNTTAVTSASRIILQPTTDASNLPSAPTCVAPAAGAVVQSARVAGTSFSFTLPSTTGTTCWNYSIIN